jgi:hypothetical protein
VQGIDEPPPPQIRVDFNHPDGTGRPLGRVETAHGCSGTARPGYPAWAPLAGVAAPAWPPAVWYNHGRTTAPALFRTERTTMSSETSRRHFLLGGTLATAGLVAAAQVQSRHHPVPPAVAEHLRRGHHD